MKTSILISITWLLTILLSCNEIRDCQLDSNSDVAAVVFKSLDDQELIFSFDSVKLESPELVVLGNDTITGVYLPLDYESQEVRYTFFTDSIDYDLTLSYSKSISVYDTKCEPSMSFRNLQAASDTFDSLRVISDIMNTKIPINLEIYF